MGYNARNDEIRDNVTRLQREWKAQRARWPTRATQYHAADIGLTTTIFEKIYVTKAVLRTALGNLT
jgi:hypothetical protein